MGAVTLVVGGQKAGKSSTAARLAAGSGRPVVVVAPAVASDEEMAERIARHREDRPGGWATLETFDLVGALAEAGDRACVVVDAFDTWLADAMGRAGLWTDDAVAALGPDGAAAADRVLSGVDALVSVAVRRDGPTVVVAGQPGVGPHALGAGARRYVDLHGLALQRLGAAGRVLLVVAGRALELP